MVTNSEPGRSMQITAQLDSITPLPGRTTGQRAMIVTCAE
jgi:hypothetical protein